MKIILLHLPNNNLRLVERIHPNLLFILTLEPFTPVPKNQTTGLHQIYLFHESRYSNLWIPFTSFWYKKYLTILDRLYLIFLKVDNAQLQGVPHKITPCLPRPSTQGVVFLGHPVQFFAFSKTGSSLLTIMLYKILESNIVIKMQSQTSSKLKVHQREEVISWFKIHNRCNQLKIQRAIVQL